MALQRAKMRQETPGDGFLMIGGLDHYSGLMGFYSDLMGSEWNSNGYSDYNPLVNGG